MTVSNIEKPGAQARTRDKPLWMSYLPDLATFLFVLAAGLAMPYLLSAALSDALAHRDQVTPPQRAMAQVVGVDYHPPQRGLFSTRPDYWTANFLVNGKTFAVPVPEETVRKLKLGDQVPVMLTLCKDQDLGICDISLVNPLDPTDSPHQGS